MTESPLVEGYWTPQLGSNFSYSFSEARNSMIGALLWPIAVPCGAQYLDAVQLTLEGIDEAQRLVQSNRDLRIVNNADQMEQAHLDGKVAVLLGLEGHNLGSSLAVLRSMHSLGARFVSITGFTCTTPWAGAALKNDNFYDGTQPYSLTNFGEVILILNHK